MSQPADRAVIFDFDGTLVDASEAICFSFNQALAQNGLPPWEPDSIRRMIGRPLREMFAIAFPGSDAAAIDRFVEQYRAAFLPVAVSKATILPGCREILNELASRYQFAIATSRAGLGTRRILDAMGLNAFFPVVVGIQDVTHPKPHPEPVVLALARLNVSPARAFLVGDTTDDMAAGKAAGVFAIGVTTGVHSAEELSGAGADAVVGCLWELLQIEELRTES